MERFKGTKGEWYASSSSEIISMPSQCKISSRVSGLTRDEVIANRELMATAPELLEALIAMIDIVDSTNGVAGWHLNGDIAYWDEFNDIDIARDIIEKALNINK